MKRNLRRSAALAALLCAPAAALAQADVDLRVYSSEPGRGSLVVVFDDGGVQPLFQNVCAGGVCVFGNTDPGFRSPGSTPAGAGLHALPSGVRVSLEVLGIEPSTSIQVGGALADRVGETVLLGTTPLHVHPVWQAVIPVGVTREISFQFRLTAPAPYAPSTSVTTSFVNQTVQSPTATATATPSATATASASASATPVATATATVMATATATASTTATASPSATASSEPAAGCLGDCDEDGQVTVDELVTGIDIALGRSPLDRCPAFDGGDDGQVTVDEIVQAVARALDGCG